MQGDVVTAARWLFAGMIASTALLVAGLIFVAHGEKLCPGLFRGGAAPCPSGTPEGPAQPEPPAAPCL
jgi:hypothetical protein